MKMNTFNELEKASMKKPSFLIMENGEHKVVSELDNLGYGNTTLRIKLDGMDAFYKQQISDLQSKIDKQDKIIQELISAIKTLNKGV